MTVDYRMTDEQYQAFLVERRARILEHIADSAKKVGRDPQDVLALAVSKTVTPREVVLARQAGWDVFGENRPQELKRKLFALADEPCMEGVRFDMIGNLQTNKINQVLGSVELIHSISSTHLAEAVSRRAVARGVVARVLMEVNVSGEGSKSGFSPEEARVCCEHVSRLEGLSLEGLMTMAPAYDADGARRAFSGLRDLRDELEPELDGKLPVLSCGMSDDFGIAVEEGSTLVRLGRIVFDPGYELD